MIASVVAVIPARWASTRFPGKPMAELAGEPMIVHVVRRASEARTVDHVIVATDDERIAEAADVFDARVCMTSDQHRSGTERIAEVCDLMDWDDNRIVVNLQGDEPTMPAALIDQCADNLLCSSVITVIVACILAGKQSSNYFTNSFGCTFSSQFIKLVQA